MQDTMLEKQIELHLKYLDQLQRSVNYGVKLNREAKRIINATIVEVIFELDNLYEKLRSR